MLTTEQIVYIVLAAVGLFLVLYGWFRKFSRMGWWGYQVLALFGCTLALNAVVVPDENGMAFWLVSGAFLVCAGVILGLGAAVRAGFEQHATKPKKASAFVLRLFDGILGVITAVVNLFALLCVLGGPTALVLEHFNIGTEFFTAAKEFMLWGEHPYVFFSQHFVDFLLIGFLLLFIKGGYRLGLLRSAWTVLMLLLGIGCFGLSIYAAITFPVVSDWSKGLVAAFVNLGELWSTVLGYGIVALGLFIGCIIILSLLNLLVDLGVRDVGRVGVLRVMDGVIVSIVFFALGLAIVCGLNYAIVQVCSGAFGEAAMQWATATFPLKDFVNSAPLNAYLYQNNFLLPILGVTP